MTRKMKISTSNYISKTESPSGCRSPRLPVSCHFRCRARNIPPGCQDYGCISFECGVPRPGRSGVAGCFAFWRGATHCGAGRRPCAALYPGRAEARSLPLHRAPGTRLHRNPHRQLTLGSTLRLCQQEIGQRLRAQAFRVARKVGRPHGRLGNGKRAGTELSDLHR
jgi:hypothetical protein